MLGDFDSRMDRGVDTSRTRGQAIVIWLVKVPVLVAMVVLATGCESTTTSSMSTPAPVGLAQMLQRGTVRV